MCIIPSPEHHDNAFFLVIVSGMIELGLHETNVLLSISFVLLDLFDYRRGKYQLFEEKYE